MDERLAGEVCARFRRGAPSAAPRPVAGGLLHRVWHVATTQGRFAVKVLNPAIIRQPGLRAEYARTERIAARMVAGGIPAAVALDPGDGPARKVANEAVLVYDWIDGETLPAAPAPPERTWRIGQILGQMHRLDLAVPDLSSPSAARFSDEDWAALLTRAAAAGLPWAETPERTLAGLRAWSALHDDTLPERQRRLVVSHRDLDRKNAFGRDAATPALIDWESAGPVNPAQELADAALDWSGQRAGPPRRESFVTLIAGYRAAYGTIPGAGSVALARVVGNWLAWLRFNLGRALGDAGPDPCERSIGRREATDTLALLRRLAANLDTWAAWFDTPDERSAASPIRHSSFVTHHSRCAVLILSAADVRALVPMSEAIRLMGVAFAELSAGRAQSPLRTPLPDTERGGVSLFMPAAVPAVGGLGLKVVSVYPTNAARGLPTILAIVALLDAETGRPLALLDGTFLTALRTGAVSGKATELLAHPDARTLLCIGAGAQAFTQVWAVCSARPGIERILVASRTRARAEGLVARLRDELPDLGARAAVAGDIHAATAAADVICTATSATSPVFDDADVRAGAHINAVGAYTHAMHEVPPGTVARAYVVVDAIDAALAEAGDLVAPLEAGIVDRAHLETELGQVVSGQKPARTAPDQITLFKSVGNAVQDIAVARFAVERAETTGRGQRVEL